MARVKKLPRRFMRKGPWRLDSFYSFSAPSATHQRDFAAIPGDEELAGDEDRAVGTADEADEHDDQELPDRVAAEQDQGDQRQHHRDRCGQRAAQRLVEARVDRLSIVTL